MLINKICQRKAFSLSQKDLVPLAVLIQLLGRNVTFLLCFILKQHNEKLKMFIPLNQNSD